jgi:apoptosis-inducing factor 3
LILANGDRVLYDKLLIATGTAPLFANIPGLISPHPELRIHQAFLRYILQLN